MQDRSKFIGGSDIAKILNLSPFGNATTVWLEKTQGKGNTFDNRFTEWGRRLERTISEAFYEAHPELTKIDDNERFVHETYDFIAGEVDGTYHTEDGTIGVLEIKTTSQYNDKQWEEGKIPEHYELQTQYYLMLTGYSEAHIVVLIGGSDYRESLVKENKELQALMLSAACNFWFNYVVPKKAPPLVDPDLETCKALYPASNGNQITIADQAALIPTLLDLKVEIKELEKKEAELTAALQAIVGPNEIAITNDGQYVISWAEIERKGYEVKPTKYRKFSVKATKQKLIGGK